MKKFLCLLLAILTLTFFGCSNTKQPTTGEYDELIQSSVAVVKTGWEEFYSEPSRHENMSNKIFIKDTRILFIKDDCEIEEFKDIKCIIEFKIYSDTYRSGGKYYLWSGINENVLVYKDGTLKLHRSYYVTNYVNMTVDTSFCFLKNVEELGAEYNQTTTLNFN